MSDHNINQPQGHLLARFRCLMEKFSQQATRWTGSSWAFLLSLVALAVWLAWGPFVRPAFNDTWQLVMNTITSIITFLMVFLIQRSQNKDTLAMQLKLNEIIGALKGASNSLINVEDLSEDEVRALHERYQRLIASDCCAGHPRASVSVEQIETVVTS